MPGLGKVNAGATFFSSQTSHATWTIFGYHNPIILLNIWRSEQIGRHFPDSILKWIFFCENVEILIEISLKFVPRGPINNITALVQIMACHQPGDKP